MKDTDYAFRKELDGTPYEAAVDAVIAALKSEGFGALTEIDVRSTLKEKLNVEFKRYVIIGACNPALAHEALSADDNIGLLLPCNVVVAETNRGSEVAILRPTAMLSLAESPEARTVAEQAESRLKRVIDAL